jgi:hypothetical protein
MSRHPLAVDDDGVSWQNVAFLVGVVWLIGGIAIAGWEFGKWLFLM